MNIQLPPTGLNPFDDPLDRILAEIALSVQLPPSLHDKARSRYEAVRSHLEATTAFFDQIEHFYPQGSMAIDATISTRGTDDEYDLDIVSQLGGRFRGRTPLDILIELEAALADYPVQRVLRQTRCVTLFYADKMHLDVTPSLRVYGTLDRESLITHAKGPRRSADDRLVDMNAYGFAKWYASRTPLELRMAREFHRRWLDHGGVAVRADADVDDVPDQCEFVVKNTATLALQLLKRFRNIRYASYSGRIAPSVVLSYYAGLAAQPSMSLSAMLVRLANWIIRDIEQASLYGRLLQVTNPICEADVFTDRWPAYVAQQDEFADHLRELVRSLEAMRKGEMIPNTMMDVLRRNFGDRVRDPGRRPDRNRGRWKYPTVASVLHAARRRAVSYGHRCGDGRQPSGLSGTAPHLLRAQDLMMATILSIDEQLAEMKATWPQFAPRRVNRRAHAARWVGRVKPQYTSYSLEILYELGSFPEVRVLSPELIRLPGNAEGQLPHVYPPAEDPTLCLFDPREREWSPAMTIASTTVPWAIDWLACYELWLVTGRWTGGGRHAGLESAEAMETTR